MEIGDEVLYDGESFFIVDIYEAFGKMCALLCEDRVPEFGDDSCEEVDLEDLR